MALQPPFIPSPIVNGASNNWLAFPVHKVPVVTVAQTPAEGDFGPFTPGTETDGIQEAINYVASKGGGMVFIRRGKYYLHRQVTITSSNIMIMGEGAATQIYAASDIQYTIPLNVLFNIGIDFSLNSYALQNIVIAYMKFYHVPQGTTSTSVNYSAIGGILPSHSAFHHLWDEYDGSGGTQMFLFGANPYGWSEDVVFDSIYTINMSSIGLQSSFPLVSSASGSGNGATNNMRKITISNIFHYQNTSSGDDRIFIFTQFPGTGPVYARDITIENIYEYIDTGGQGVNLVKLDGSNSGRILDVTIRNLYFMNFGTFVSNATFPLIAYYTQSSGNTQPASIENLTVENVYAYNSNNISIIVNNGNSGSYYYLAPRWVFKNIVMDNYANSDTAPIQLEIPAGFPSTGYEDIEIDGLLVNFQGSSPNTPAVQIFSNANYTYNGLIKIRHVRAINTSWAYGNLFPAALQLGGAYSLTANPQNVTVEDVYQATSTTSPYQRPQPQTPSVPASGTAVTNTYVYPVIVYLYGGSVTEVQITPAGGSPVTVFSSSTGVAMTGQGFRLNPGDSITITYSTAPSWVWLAA